MSSPYDPYDQSRADLPPPRGGRPPYRPPVGIPSPQPERPWRSAAASVAVHALLLFLVLTPIFASDQVREAIAAGAGGPGPAGGGGGGRGGTGGENVKERVQYLQVAPPPPPTRQPATPPVVPPLVPPVPPPKRETKPEPVPEVRPDSIPAAPTVDVDTDVETGVDAALTAGRGGGSGNDGTAGNGPGSGGGTGSGVGTGRGSGAGPGTGGGEGAVYPPSPVALFIVPLPAPEKIKPYAMRAEFDVDEKGQVVAFTFNKSKDGGYNRRLEQMLRDVRFRPAVRAADGLPVRARAVISYDVF